MQKHFPQKILIAICSSHVHAARRAAVRETWLRRLPVSMQGVFFFGIGPKVSEPATVALPVDDSYQALPAKVQAFFRYAEASLDFDYLFKCDDDTYLCAERLDELVDPACDLIGSQDCARHNCAYGGAGYLLTRKAVRLAAEAPTPRPGNEDVWVSCLLRNAGVKPHFTPRLFGGRRQFPRPDNDLVTAHHCSPALLRLIDEGMDDPKAIAVSHAFTLTTPVSTWAVNLLRNGVFASATNGLLGRWRHHPDEEALELDWHLKDKAKDVLRKTADGYCNEFISLTPYSPE